MTIRTIQPSIIDTYIRDASGSYKDVNYGTETDVQSGENLGITYDKSRTLIKFALPPATAVAAAILYLYEYAENADTTRLHSVYRLKRAWVETIFSPANTNFNR